ncbi:PDK repeat-containing protein [Bernardetia litoralis DSM 6794]|uniref:PDK repeat-containing protein n=1 Tax=Bernardetia litoralis (strain ATCC 23117 / DSM 6794 / NBRC 15988 / NCIMB 1366 / Fx l1 / Sio-4) TaxID=880071 RepID=I4AK80_BERLS|nr:PKD domain-containing protein [Bernardetia litoralis]AFM04365.1 PDK repeat-containing protein [Bernardetia litoralis DSM 6794]
MKKNLFLFYFLSILSLLVFMPLDVFGQKIATDNQNHSEQTIAKAPKTKTPLTFIENKNQWDNVVKYRASIPSGYLFIRQNSLQYSFYDGNALKHGHEHGHEQDTSKETEEEHEKHKDKIKAHSIEVEFENANPSPKIISQELHETKFNYFLGNDKNKWAENARGFAELTYQELYPNINLHLYLQEDQLKYDFIVDANADASKIAMNYKYADKVTLESGHLHIQTSVNKIIEQAPYSYQIINGQKIEVPSKFVLKQRKGKDKTPQVTFDFPEGYDKNYELIIDPILIFSTFSGSLEDNWGNTATYDENGNLYSGGTVFGGAFPVTTGAFDVTFDGLVDVAILKYNATGTGVFYATFLGGNSSDIPSSMIVNSRNELIILGVTGSSNFPTVSAYDDSFNGGSTTAVLGGYEFDNGSDLFISKLNSTGSNLIASTFLGGGGNDGLNTQQLGGGTGTINNELLKNYGDEVRNEVILDASDNIYIASSTNSNNFPMVSAHRTTFQGRQEGVVAKLNPTLNSLLWSTYIGGNNLDAAFGIQISSAGDIYVVGGTMSDDLITHGGTMQSNYRGEIDGFIVRYASNFAWQGASYLGTNAYDQAYYVDVDLGDNVFVFGQTKGSQPVTNGVYFNDRGGLFIRKISPNLNTILMATTIGGRQFQPGITPTAFMVNDCGNIYLAGWGSTNIYAGYPNHPTYLTGINVAGMPITSNAIQSFTDIGGNDFYTMILSEDATDLVYGSFFGGTNYQREHVDGGTSRFDKKTGTIYQAVCACTGSNFTTTPGAFSNTNNSANCNNAAFKIELGVLKADFVSANSLRGCVPFTVNFLNQSVEGVTYEWDFGGLGTSTQNNPSFTFTEGGTYRVKLIATNPFLCVKTDSAFLTITVSPADFEISADTTICKGQSVQLEASGGTSYSWTPSTGLSNPNIANPVAIPTETTTYTLTTQNAAGCQKELTTTITVLDELIPSFTFNISDPCSENPIITFINTSQNATSYLWDFGNGQTSTAINPPAQNYTTGTYTIKLVAENDICNDKDSITQQIVIDPDVFTFNGDTTICFGQSVQFNVTGGTSYEWTPTTGLSDATIGNPIASPAQTTTYTVKVIGRNGCEEERQITMVVGEEIIPDFEIVQSNLCEEFPTVSIVNNTVGATSYLWDFGNGQTSTSQNPTNLLYDSAGNYRIKLIVGNIACSDSITKEFDYSTNNFFVSPDKSICLGQSLPLESGEGINFSWTPITGLSDPTISNPIASPTETTTYTVSITTQNGCVKEEEVTITVLPELTPDFDVNILDRCDKLPIVEIINNSVGATSFFWDFGDGRTSTVRNPAPFQYDSEGVYTITLRIENSLCQDSTSNNANSVIDDNNIFLSTIRMPKSPTICRGQSTELNVIGGDNFEWTPTTGLSDPTIRNPIASPDQTTIYNVRISNMDGGCFTDSTVTVTVVDKLVLDFEVTHSPECGAPATILFNSKNTGNGNWIWEMGNGDSINVSNPTEYTYTEAGTYTIKLKASNGVCDEEQTATVTVDNVLPPNVITPNGDGLNETFVLDKANIGWKLKIYNRWGTEVFSADDYNNDWGNKAEPAMYYYYLTSPDGDTCRGWIHVLQ